ncbi:MAG: ATP-binding protein [Bacillota bacterium]
MLIQFTVSNFLSFKDEQTFSMVANTGEKDTELLDNVFRSVDDRMSLLRSSVVYGANASGKSNFVKALSFYLGFILASTQSIEQQAIATRPYKLETHYSEKSTKLEAVLEVGDCIYRYGYELTHSEVLREWLYVIEAKKQRKREKLIFERTRAELAAKDSGWKKLMVVTKKNSLLLTVAAQFNLTTAKKIVNYIAAKIMVVSDVQALFSSTTEYLYAIQENGTNLGIIDDVCKLLQAADIAIDGFKIISRDIKKNELPEHVPAAFANFLSALPSESYNFKQVVTTHKQYDSDGKIAGMVNFDMASEESIGTVKLFSMSIPLLMLLRNGGTLIIDELESSLHPLLVRYITGLFNSSLTNPHNAQLIFTTHYDGILNNGMFRRDQIWFAEKGDRGATELYSLLEFRQNKTAVRKDASYDRDYLAGRYGAIPLVSENYLTELHSQVEKYG